jgi:hypothetical protein
VLQLTRVGTQNACACAARYSKREKFYLAMLSVPNDAAQEISLLQNEASNKLSHSIQKLNTINGFSAKTFKKTRGNLQMAVKLLSESRNNLHSILAKIR